MWFRRDLRVESNPALEAAVALAEELRVKVVPLFVLDPELVRSGRANRMAFLYDALRSFRASGVPLVVRFGRSDDVVVSASEEFRSAAVVCTGDFSPLGRARDARVARRLSAVGLNLQTVGSPYLVDPGSIRKGDGTPFKVFTPFRRAWEQHLGERVSPRRSSKIVSASSVSWFAGTDLERSVGLGDIPQTPTGSSKVLPRATEGAAWSRLQAFLETNLHTYDAGRNIPALDATSRLSADLKFGLLHPAQIVPLLEGGGAGASVFRSELCWRDFYADVLWHRPETAHQPFNPAMEAMEVDTGALADERFDAWCHGRTGYPFVDAGMRQLLLEGWMHNRMRMVTASFLVKDLHLDWRRGAAWFMEQLVDADVASNQHGWQWTAGTGTDAAPYFRIFNPVSQGLKFDPSGAYIRRYVPELAPFSDREIHEPWSANGGGLFGGVDGYPAPIIDHADERRESLARLGALKHAGVSPHTP